MKHLDVRICRVAVKSDSRSLEIILNFFTGRTWDPWFSQLCSHACLPRRDMHALRVQSRGCSGVAGSGDTLWCSNQQRLRLSLLSVALEASQSVWLLASLIEESSGACSFSNGVLCFAYHALGAVLIPDGLSRGPILDRVWSFFVVTLSWYMAFIFLPLI